MLRGTRTQDLEGRRRAVFSGGIRQPVAVGEHAAVALVADDSGACPEDIAVTEAGAFEDPVPGAVHGVAAEAVRHVPADAVVAAAGEADAGHGILRTAHRHVGPERRDLALSVR